MVNVVEQSIAPVWLPLALQLACSQTSNGLKQRMNPERNQLRRQDDAVVRFYMVETANRAMRTDFTRDSSLLALEQGSKPQFVANRIAIRQPEQNKFL
ncbi:hypothetical protein [Burkholderia sp. BCC1993]|uniref:hypothetical protein n=1 Tax=Burkholderia sp. BCC1993 TaxID=2817444 RepID=UPI002AB002D0|nr:hypothetical protein [Burkholderia sp. BCC1993]